MTATQSNYQDDQNFDIDIDQVYNDYIQVIDAARSPVNINDPNNQSKLKKITSDSFTGTATTSALKPEKTPQESRCHAFYRLLGFPVVSDKGIYNPGHDIIIEKGREITIEKKVSIANSPPNGFQDLSTQRETYVNDILKIFSNNQSIDAQVLALSSINIREFSAQSYLVPNNSLVGDDSSVIFQNYQDNNGNKATKYTNKRFHIINPFMVDARIDLSTPAEKKVAIPFAKNDSQLKISETTSVKRPLLEKIIIDRFTVTKELDGAGTLAQSTVDYIKRIPAIQDEKLVQDVSSGKVYKLTEQQQFIKYLNIIRAMMVALVQAQISINIVQSRYYWLPIPSTTGPEGGSNINGVFSNLPDELSTIDDAAIVLAQINTIIDKIDSQAAALTGTPDIAGYAFGKFTTTFDSTTTASLGDTNSKQLTQLIEKRTHDLSIANKALRTIEIIMGEFSGLGLCDIIAIMGALYVMPVNSLLGFLDDDSYTRAKLVVDLPETNPSNIAEALTDLDEEVLNFYNIMNDIYKEVRKTNGR